MKHRVVSAGVMVLALATGTAQAAFMVEAHSTGLANANFASNSASETSTASLAPGKTASGSRFGGAGTDATTDPDRYIYSYTPGTDADNAVYTAGTVLGDTTAADADGLGPISPTYAPTPLLASGEIGGGTGFYNIYITWPASTNTNTLGSRIIVTNDGPNLAYNPVNNNTGGTSGGTNGANDAWLLIAGNVPLTAGTTYTVTQEANSITFVSQRSHGVLWEPVAIPEPSSIALLTVSAFGVLRRRRA